MLAGVKSLTEYAGITLGWKKIKSTTFKPVRISDMKPTPFDKVQEMYESGILQVKWILRIFMTGAAIAPFPFPIAIFAFALFLGPLNL